MSVLKHPVVLKCHVCGNMYTIQGLQTTVEDVDGRKLHALLKGIAQDGLCTKCRKHRDYLRVEGRGEEWQR